MMLNVHVEAKRMQNDSFGKEYHFLLLFNNLLPSNGWILMKSNISQKAIQCNAQWSLCDYVSMHVS
jgi:hypothetical protein